jgi:hypothetical protein
LAYPFLLQTAFGGMTAVSLQKAALRFQPEKLKAERGFFI